MFILSNFINSLATLIEFVLGAYMWMVVIRAIMSWFSPDPYNPIVLFLHDITDPLLFRIRRLIPLSAGGIDFSPIILIMAIIFLQSFLVPTLRSFANMIGY